MNDTREHVRSDLGLDCIISFSKYLLLFLVSCLRYMSMLSLNLKTPFALRTPSMPSGSLGKGSLRSPLSTLGSADLSVTSTSPCALIASISAGIIS